MAETKPTYEETDVRHVRVTAFCKEHDWPLAWDGVAMLTNPPKYRHNCKDGCEYILDKVYPTIEHRDVARL